MKKVFQIVAIFIFLGLFSAPTFASVYSSVNVAVIDDEPVKKEATASDTKATENKETDKKSECTKSTEEKASCTKATEEKSSCTKDKPACTKK